MQGISGMAGSYDDHFTTRFHNISYSDCNERLRQLGLTLLGLYERRNYLDRVFSRNRSVATSMLTLYLTILV